MCVVTDESLFENQELSDASCPDLRFFWHLGLEDSDTFTGPL